MKNNDMEKNPIKNDVRKARRERRLGKNAACMLCGKTELESLTRVKRSSLPEHHVAGKTNDSDLLVTLCLNCHAEIHEKYRDNGVDLSSAQDRTPLDQLISFLRAVGTFLCQLGGKMADWADWLTLFVGQLNAEFPKWRELASDVMNHG